jgi:hypothetical protein
VKTPSKGSGHPAPADAARIRPEALEEKITHLTEGVARTASKYKVAILVVLVAIVAVVAISSLVTYLAAQQEESWSGRVDELFRKSAAEIRIAAPALADELRGTRIEPVLVARYAHWLYEQAGAGDRERAFTLVEEAMQRHPGDLVLDLCHGELVQVRTEAEGFVLPPIPEAAPPTLPTPPETGATVTPPSGPGIVTPVNAPVPVPPTAPPKGAVSSGAAAPGAPAPPPATEDPLGDDPLDGEVPNPDGGAAPPKPAPGDGQR